MNESSTVSLVPPFTLYNSFCSWLLALACAIYFWKHLPKKKKIIFENLWQMIEVHNLRNSLFNVFDYEISVFEIVKLGLVPYLNWVPIIKYRCWGIIQAFEVGWLILKCMLYIIICIVWLTWSAHLGQWNWSTGNG